jgi:hypothetical protein
MSTEQAKELLKKNGYYIDNLWHVDDVQQRCYCTEEEAQEILDMSLTNEDTIEHIQDAIYHFIVEKDLPKDLDELIKPLR